MDHAKKLFFIAVLPDEAIQEEVKKLKIDFRDRFGSGHALNAPAHLTLIPPFYWPHARIWEIKENLDRFAGEESSFAVKLENFGAFPPRVIFIDVVWNESLNALQERLLKNLDEKFRISERLRSGKPFNPHMTLAFRDLTRENFRRAWEEFGEKTFSRNFLINKVVMLIHEQKHWNILHQAIFRK